MIVSLFLALFMISKSIPIEIGPMVPSALVLGLMFPFVDKKIRIAITTAYQGNLIYGVYQILESGLPSLEALMDYSIESLPDASTFSLSYSQSTEISITYLMSIMSPQYALMMNGIIIMAAFLSSAIVFYGVFSFVAIYTQPYSCYYFYKSIGLFNLIEKNTGGRIKIEYK